MLSKNAAYVKTAHCFDHACWCIRRPHERSTADLCLISSHLRSEKVHSSCFAPQLADCAAAHCRACAPRTGLPVYAARGKRRIRAQLLLQGFFHGFSEPVAQLLGAVIGYAELRPQEQLFGQGQLADCM